MFYSHFVRHVADGQYSMPDDMPNAGFPIVGGNYMTYRAFLRRVDTYQKCPAVPGVFLQNRRAMPGVILKNRRAAGHLCKYPPFYIKPKYFTSVIIWVDLNK